MPLARKTEASSPATARAKPNEHGQLSFTSLYLRASVPITESHRQPFSENPSAASSQLIWVYDQTAPRNTSPSYLPTFPNFSLNSTSKYNSWKKVVVKSIKYYIKPWAFGNGLSRETPRCSPNMKLPPIGEKFFNIACLILGKLGKIFAEIKQNLK